MSDLHGDSQEQVSLREELDAAIRMIMIKPDLRNGAYLQAQ